MFGSVFASFPPLRTEKPPLFFIFSPFSHPSSPFSLLCAELPFVVRAQSNRRQGIAEHHAHACLCALQARSPMSLRRIVSRETIFCAFARANVHCRRWRKRRAKVTCALLLSENCRDLLLFVSHIIFLSHAIFVWTVRIVYFCARPFMTQTASKIIFHRTMQTLKTILFLLLAAFMIYAGVSHLTFHRLDFVAEVPMWLRFSDGFTDFVVLASGVVEIVLGLSMLLLWRHKAKIGALLALFFVLVFPGNLNQYIYHIDAFGLNTDTHRLIRLFFQPVLIAWALWCTGGWSVCKAAWNACFASRNA